MTAIITTIIGILLAAAAALMAFWYGGDAFEGGSTKAAANTIINELQNVSHAVQMHNMSSGTVLEVKDYKNFSQDRAQNLVSEGWLSQKVNNSFNEDPIYVVNQDGNSRGFADHIYTSLGSTEDGARICREVVRQALRSNTAEVQYVPSSSLWHAASLARRPFGCFKYHDQIYYVVHSI